MGEICNFANLVLIIKVVWVSTIPRQAINTPVIKMTKPVLIWVLKSKGRHNKCKRYSNSKWLNQVHRDIESRSYTTGYENQASGVQDIEDIQGQE